MVGPELSEQPFWQPLAEVIEWASEAATSTLCSCLATHSVLQLVYGQKRVPRPDKTWGVFPHHVVEKRHPLVNDVNTRFDVPHSRWNDVSRAQFDAAGLRVLAESDGIGVHLATSADGLRFVLFQGHPEYDTVSLLKEYKREVLRFAKGEIDDYAPFPEHYIPLQEQAMLNEYRARLAEARIRGGEAPEFPEALVSSRLDNTWHDTAQMVVANWIGLVYQHHQQRSETAVHEGDRSRQSFESLNWRHAIDAVRRLTTSIAQLPRPTGLDHQSMSDPVFPLPLPYKGSGILTRLSEFSDRREDLGSLRLISTGRRRLLQRT